MTPQQIIQEAFIVKDAKEVAKVLEVFSVDDIVTTIQKTSTKHIAALLNDLSPVIAAGVFKALPTPLRSKTLRHMPPSAAANVLRQFSPQEQDDILKFLDAWMLEDVKASLHYPIGSAGELMSAQNPILCDDLTVEEAMAQLRTIPTNESSELFLISRGGQFVGTLTYHNLFKAEREARLSSLNVSHPAKIGPLEDQRILMRMTQDGHDQSIPVVDQSGCLLGSIPPGVLEKPWIASIMEKFQSIVGVPPHETRDPSIWRAIGRRAWWIGGNFVIASFVVSLLAMVDPTLAAIRNIALFLPFLLILPFSFASQTFGIVLRGTILQSWSSADKPKIAFREFRLSLLMGGIVGLATMVAISYWNPGLQFSIAFGLAVWIAMALSGVISAIISLGLEQNAKSEILFSVLLLTLFTNLVGISSYFGLLYLFNKGLS